jgi:nucleoid-associated protein YgaU
LLQPAAPRAAVDRVIVDVISYAADGAVLLEGRSAPPPPPVDSVRVYLDDAAIDSAPIAPDGTWRLPLADVQSGVYTLRVDQLDRAGQVVSRFETPFKREDPVTLARLETGPAAPPGRSEVRASLITVQPGYTLWGIASDRYGSGFNYVQIFEANDDQIRDPDLIYPGQIFDLPDLPDRPGLPTEN